MKQDYKDFYTFIAGIGIIIGIIIISMVLSYHDIQIKLDYLNDKIYESKSCDELKYELNWQNQFYFKNPTIIKSVTKYLVKKECGI